VSTRADTELLYPRLGTPRDYSYLTYGGQVDAIAKALGYSLFPWQRHIVDVALEYKLDEDGRPVFHYREVRLWVPRQSGKTILMMALMTWRCIVMSETLGKKQNVKFFSTTGLHAKQKWGDEHVPILEDSILKGQFEVRRSPGLEGFLWDNGSQWSIGASTEKSGHGDSLDMVIADEFFSQEDDRIEEGARPTMITREDPQIWFVSTFGSADPTKEHRSGPLWEKVDDSRERCRENDHGSVASFEYSAADFDDYEKASIDYGNHLLWLKTMPGLAENGGLKFYNLQTVQQEYESMKLHAFKRAYLNLRAPRGAKKKPALIKPKEWDRLLTDASSFRRKSKLFLGLDVERDNSRSSIVIAGPNVMIRDPETREPIHQHLELVSDEEGSDWIVDEVARLILRHDISAVALDAGGPAARLLPDLEPVCKRSRVEIKKYSGKSYQAACEAFRVAAVGATIRNNGQHTLAEAVDQGIRRDVSDLWVWDRKSPLSFIAPLIAATVAHRAAQEGAAGGSRQSAYEEEDAMVWA
jgi:phage terminase large subunit-like protein